MNDEAIRDVSCLRTPAWRIFDCGRGDPTRCPRNVAAMSHCHIFFVSQVFGLRGTAHVADGPADGEVRLFQIPGISALAIHSGRASPMFLT